MIKLLKTILLIVVLVHAAQGQQIGMFNHYFYKPFINNPAFAGDENCNEAFTVNRTQWTGFSNAPQFNLISVDGILKTKKVGLGISIYNDRKGISNRTGGDLAYSYKLNFNDETQLSLGLSAGVVNQLMNFSKAVSESTNDPYLFTNTEQKTTFNLNAGIAFKWKDLTVATSAPQLTQNKIIYIDNAGQSKASYIQYRHYIGSVAYKVNLNKTKSISISPLALVRLVPGAPMQYEGNVNFSIENKFWIGASYKSNYAISAQAGVCLYKKLNIGYSYEIITAKLANQAALSHEIMLSFLFGKTKVETESSANSNRFEQQTDNTRAIDSLNHELENKQNTINEKEQKISELNKQLEEIKKQKEKPIQLNPSSNNISENSNNNPEPGNTDHSTSVNNNKINGVRSIENSTLIITVNETEIKKSSNQTTTKGYYVIAGTFFYEDFANDEAKRFKTKGFSNSGCIKSQTNEFTYVYLKKLTTKEDAIKHSKDCQTKGIKDAWVLAIE